MRAGGLRHRLTLIEPGETVVAGDATPTETTKATIWGSMRGLTGRERELHAEADYAFGFRYLAGVSARWLVGLGARRFKITQPPLDPDGRRRELLVFGTEILR